MVGERCSRTCPRGWWIPAGDPTDIRGFNVRLAKGSGGLLPQVTDPSEFEIATVRCSHTNATLRIAQLGARSLNREYADETGHISMARILERQPPFKVPLEKGLRFTVISGALVLRCPGCCFFVVSILIDLHFFSFSQRRAQA